MAKLKFFCRLRKMKYSKCRLFESVRQNLEKILTGGREYKENAISFLVFLHCEKELFAHLKRFWVETYICWSSGTIEIAQ